MTEKRIKNTITIKYKSNERNLTKLDTKVQCISVCAVPIQQFVKDFTQYFRWGHNNKKKKKKKLMYMDVTLEKLHAVEELTFTFVYAMKTFRPHHYQRTVTWFLSTTLTYLLTYHVCGLSVCLLVKSVSCAAQNETTQPSKLSFRVWTHRSPRNHVLHGSMVPPCEEQTLLGVTLGHTSLACGQYSQPLFARGRERCGPGY